MPQPLMPKKPKLTGSVKIYNTFSSDHVIYPAKNSHWTGLAFPSPGDLSNPGTEPRSPTLKADSLPSEPPREFPTAILKGLNYKSKTHSVSQKV